MHEKDLSVLQPQDLLGRKRGAVPCRLRRQTDRLVDGDPFVGGGDHVESRRFTGHGDLRVVRDLARRNAHRVLVDQHTTGGDQLARLAAGDVGKTGGDGLIEAHLYSSS